MSAIDATTANAAGPASGTSTIRPRIGTKIWSTVLWAFTGFFVLNVFGVIASVATNSFATRWLGTWFPDALTMRWYASAWSEFQLDDVLIVTFEVVGPTSGPTLRVNPISAVAPGLLRKFFDFPNGTGQTSSNSAFPGTEGQSSTGSFPQVYGDPVR